MRIALLRLAATLACLSTACGGESTDIETDRAEEVIVSDARTDGRDDEHAGDIGDAGASDSEVAVDLCQSGCLIGDICVPDGFSNPDNACLWCDSVASQTEWSHNDGAFCSDGDFCTVDDVCASGVCSGSERSCDDGIVCNGVETCDENACAPGIDQCLDDGLFCHAASGECRKACTGCVIESVCYGDGQVNPDNLCEICDPEVADDAWTPNDGAPCNDDVLCNGVDTCAAGACSQHSGDPCVDDRFFCNGLESCDLDADRCVHSGFPCESGVYCVEEGGECCEPLVPTPPAYCNEQGDVESVVDLCGNTFVSEDCHDTHGLCESGICGCEIPYFEPDCEESCVRFVDSNRGAPTNDGLSWEDALDSIQDAIDAASLARTDESFPPCDVWVATGTYDQSLSLRDHVRVFGGFSGDETEVDQREIEANPTTLARSEAGVVVSCRADSGCSTGVELNGVTITSLGSVYGLRGIHSVNASIRVVNVTLEGMSHSQASIMRIQGGEVDVIDSAFRSNTCDDIGCTSISVQDGALAVHGSTFDLNFGSDVGAQSSVVGAVGSTVTLSNTVFSRTHAQNAAVHLQTSDLSANNCVFSNNGAFAVFSLQSTARLTHCVFVGNYTVFGSRSSSISVVNSIMWNNGDLMFHTGGNLPAISHSLLHAHYSGEGNFVADPLFLNAAAGEVRLLPASPCLNRGDNAAAAEIATDLYGSPRMFGETVDIGAHELQRAAGDEFPETCSELAAIYPDLPDGSYRLFVAGNKDDGWPVYCRDMATAPIEYLEFPVTGDDANFSQTTIPDGSAWTGTDLRSRYDRVRFDPTTLEIDAADRTFTTNTGWFLTAETEIRSMDFGSAAGCTAAEVDDGIGNIDLTSTPFRIASEPDIFVLSGFRPAGGAVFSADRQVVNLTGGGHCGAIAAAGGVIQLELLP